MEPGLAIKPQKIQEENKSGGQICLFKFRRKCSFSDLWNI